MKTIHNYLRLVRYPNLLFIILTQYLFHYLMVVPILKNNLSSTQLSHFDFALLVFSTVLIAAAGYVINDYFDVKMDSINKPRKLFITKSINRRPAMLAHQILNAIAIAIGIYLSWKVGNFNLAFINPIIAALLWFYSTGYKKQPFIGNFLVALLTGMVVLVVIFYEQNLFHPENELQTLAASAIFIRAFFYFLFAFLVSLIREIVKDLEDIKGDEMYGCRTLPIVLGIPNTKSIVFVLSTVVMALLGFIEIKAFESNYFLTIIYLAQTIQFPIIVMLWMLLRADTQKDYNRISTLVKAIMLMGILTIVYFYFLMNTVLNS